MKINTHNDWDPLEEIIVGHAHNARISMDRSTHSFNYAHKTWSDVEHLHGHYPKQVIDEANEDADNLADVLTKLGVKVHRPSIVDWDQQFATMDWKSQGWNTWSPRDIILPLGDMLIETPGPVRARYYEILAYQDILYQAFADGALWMSTPKPRLLDNSYDIESDTLGRPTLLDKEIVFDAPNVVRVGRDILYQISNSGNLKGFQWLKRLLEPQGYRLHYSELYSYAHFDSTILPLRPGLVLLNSSRVNDSNCPEIFKKWDKIYFDDCVPQPSNVPGTVAAASPYIGMNLLSVDPNTVIVERTQLPLIRVLESHGINCIPVRYRHITVLSGGLHCCTLDLRRRGELEDYCS